MSGPMKRWFTILCVLVAPLASSARAAGSTIVTAPTETAPPRSLRTLWILDARALDAMGVERPTRLTFDAGGRLHVLDAATGRVVTLDQDGRLLHAVGGYGADAASFRLPVDLAVDRNQSLLVLDRGRREILAFDREGRFLAARSLGDRAADEAREPNVRLLLDRFGALWLLAPRERDLIRLDERLSPSRPGRTLTPEDSLHAPRGASFLPGGDVWLLDSGALRRFAASGRLSATRPLDGALADADPTEIACDPSGYLFVADRKGQRILALDSAGAPAFERVLGGSAVPWRPAALALGAGDRIAVADPERREIQLLAIERGEGRP